MRKLYFLLVFLLIPNFLLLAQKIKIDKKTDIVSIDGTDAAKINETKHNGKEKTFVFSNLNDDQTITFKEVRDEIGNHYFEVTSSFNDKESEIDYESLTFSFNDKSIISNLIIKKHNFLTTSGINTEAVNTFLNTPIESKKEKLAKANAIKAATQAKRQALLSKYSPVIENDTVIKNKNTGQVLGKILLMPNSKRSDTYPGFYFKDEKGNIIGRMMYTLITNNYSTFTITTYQGKRLVMNPTLTIDELENQAVKELVSNGYFGDEENAYSVWEPLHSQWLKDTDPENKERTDVEGVLKTKKGETITGKFRVSFRQTEDGMVRKPGGTIINLDGESIRHFYKDNKGKDKSKVYKVKDIQSFSVTRPDGIAENYENIAYEYTPPVVSDDALDVVNLGKSLFSKGKKDKKELIAYTNTSNPSITIYSRDGEYFMKKANEDTVTSIDLDDMTNFMLSILNGCPDLQEKTMSNREQSTEARLRLFAEDYDKCINK